MIKISGQIRKVEILSTQDCETGYGPVLLLMEGEKPNSSFKTLMFTKQPGIRLLKDTINFVEKTLFNTFVIIFASLHGTRLPPPGGGPIYIIYMFRHMGCAAKIGLVYKKSLNMGPTIHEKISK